MNKEKFALGLPSGSIRAILAIIVIGGTAVGVVALIIIAAWKEQPDLVGDIIGAIAVWFAIVTLVARDYFSAGQNSDMMKEVKELIKK